MISNRAIPPVRPISSSPPSWIRPWPPKSNASLSRHTACLGCRGFGRVDLMLDESGQPWVLELNTIPGLTETSTMPMAAQAAGISFEDLVAEVMESAFA